MNLKIVVAAHQQQNLNYPKVILIVANVMIPQNDKGCFKVTQSMNVCNASSTKL